LDENIPSIVKNMMSTDDSQVAGESVSKKKIRITSDMGDVHPSEKIFSVSRSDDDVPEKRASDSGRMTGSGAGKEGATQR
jgi:hypothetical protein